MVKTSRVGDAGRRELSLLGFADDYCVDLSRDKLEGDDDPDIFITCSLISLLHTTIAVLIGLESII